MGAIRIILKKSWTHPLRSKPYPVGTILQCDAILASSFLAEKTGELYKGEYPPDKKTKIELSQLKK